MLFTCFGGIRRLSTKNNTWIVMVPVTAVTAVNAYIQEMDHLSHGPPPYIPYDHLTQKTRRYPWGDGKRSLFFHPKYNAIPGEVGGNGKRMECGGIPFITRPAGTTLKREPPTITPGGSSESSFDEDGWRKAWQVKFKYGKSSNLSVWLIDRLTRSIGGRWLSMEEGRFELEWIDTANAWYAERQRRSKSSQSTHLLYKAIMLCMCQPSSDLTSDTPTPIPPSTTHNNIPYFDVQCGPAGLRVKVRDGVDGDCGKCEDTLTYELEPCNRVCLNGGVIEDVLGEDFCVCKTGFHGECCEQGYDLTTFVVCYIIIISLCFVFVCSMFCVGEYRHGHVLQAIPATYETEFDDWEEDQPLLEPKFVWTAPHEGNKYSIQNRSWDTYSEYSSRAGSAMSVGSFTWELGEDGSKIFKGHDPVLERLDIFEVANLRNIGLLSREERNLLVDKIGARLDFEEQIKLRSFESLSEEEAMEMMSKLNELADRATLVLEAQDRKLKELESHPGFEELDEDLLENMGDLSKMDANDLERLASALDGILSEKDKIKLQNWDQLSHREKQVLQEKMNKLQGVARKVDSRRKSAPNDEGKVELTTSAVTEGLISQTSLRTAIYSAAVGQVLGKIGMSPGVLSGRPEARLEIRARILEKLMLMSEDEIIALCKLDGMTDEAIEELSHIDRVTYLADRASCACVADIPAIEIEIKEDEARAAEEAARLRELEGVESSISSMSGVMSMSSDDEEGDDRPARRKVDLSKIKWSGPPKGAKPGFTRGSLSIGVLSTSVKNVRNSLRLVQSLRVKAHDGPDRNMKMSLSKRLSSLPVDEAEEEDEEGGDIFKQPITTRYLGHVTGFQPISDHYFLIPGSCLFFFLPPVPINLSLLWFGCHGNRVGCHGNMFGCHGNMFGCHGNRVGCHGNRVGCHGNMQEPTKKSKQPIKTIEFSLNGSFPQIQRSRDWLSTNQGPVFRDSVGSWYLSDFGTLKLPGSPVETLFQLLFLRKLNSSFTLIPIQKVAAYAALGEKGTTT
eukprot:sb/3461566/